MDNFTSEPVKRLYRSRHDRVISGVCSGLAEYFSIDVILVRILWIIITFFGGIGLFIYIAAVIIIPENREYTNEPETHKLKNGNDKTLFWGSLLIIAGIALILRQMGFFHYLQLWNIPWQMIWAVILISLGIFLLYNKNTNPEENTATEAETAFKTDMANNAAANGSKTSQIYRSRTDKMMAGVCGGLAEYLKMDSGIVRLIYVLLSFASVGIGILVYVILMFVFPEKPPESVNYSSETDGAHK